MGKERGIGKKENKGILGRRWERRIGNERRMGDRTEEEKRRRGEGRGILGREGRREDRSEEEKSIVVI